MNRVGVTIWAGLCLSGAAMGQSVPLQWQSLNVAGNYDQAPIAHSIYVDSSHRNFSADLVRLFRRYGEWKRIRRSSEDAKQKIEKLRADHRELRLKRDERRLDWESDWAIQMSRNIAEQAKHLPRVEELARWEARNAARLHFEVRGERRVLTAVEFGQRIASR